jgi:hypothetical protein
LPLADGKPIRNYSSWLGARPDSSISS